MVDGSNIAYFWRRSHGLISPIVTCSLVRYKLNSPREYFAIEPRDKIDVYDFFKMSDDHDLISNTSMYRSTRTNKSAALYLYVQNEGFKYFVCESW